MSNYITTQIGKVRDPISYSKTPLPPGGEAAWLNDTISQPYFPAINANSYNVSLPSVNPITYVKTPTVISFSGIISQPVFPVQVQLSPLLKTNALNFSPPAPPVPVASWLNDTIGEPYFSQLDINRISGNVFPVFGILPGIESMGFLTNNIQPYFSPYNTNFYVRISPMFRILLTRLLLGVGL